MSSIAYISDVAAAQKRSKIARRNKQRGSEEERRLAKRLSKATGLRFERQVLSGADKRHRGDIVCADAESVVIECKYRRQLVEKSVRSGHSAIDEFLSADTILLLVTGGGVNYRRKGFKLDWILCERTHAWNCPPIHRLGAMIDPVDTQPFRDYRDDKWVFAKLDDVLAIEGIKNLFLK